MSASVLENIKQSIISNSSQAVWDDIIESYDSELFKLLVDGDTTAFVNELADSGEDNVGLNGVQISNIQADEAAGEWSIVNTGTTYYYFPVWAEENGTLSNNNFQWSFGNGAVGNIGIGMASCEIYALSLDAETIGTSVSINVTVNGSTDSTVLFTGEQFINFSATPITINEGDILGFQTNTVTGTYNDARVTAWCRVPLTNLIGIKGADGEKGDQGVQGPAGASGSGSTAIARATLTSQSNANSTTPVPVTFDASTIDIIGITVNPTSITLPEGTYRVDLQISLNGSVTRANQRLSINVEGSPYSFVEGSAYIRNSSGHNEASLHISEFFTIGVGGGDIDFTLQGIGGTGTINTNAGGSRLLLTQYN